MTGPAPRHTQRVRVTSSRRGAATVRRRPMASAFVQQTEVGELYLSGLLRAQLRLSLAILVSGAVLLLGLPVLFAVVPLTRELRVGWVPVPWLLLGVLIYPAVVAAAAFYARATEQTERRFIEAVGGTTDR